MLISLERMKNLDNSAKITIIVPNTQIIHCKYIAYPDTVTFYPSSTQINKELAETRLNYPELVEFINKARFVEIY